jgi:hypothetical protein
VPEKEALWLLTTQAIPNERPIFLGAFGYTS